ncbi:hypothetical protein MUK42_27881 [Musa troglodytarum]|uniref:Uncharacterized protein n=1 Tax=Musa troglodytarum TaxID=320322 RepID=A0A9E7F9J0_9LILI|nr:hypothetical protein MUK42_27881 [Musa troglodytarum]
MTQGHREVVLEVTRLVLVYPQRRHAVAPRHQRPVLLHRDGPHLAFASCADEVVDLFLAATRPRALPEAIGARQRDDEATLGLAGDHGHAALVQVPGMPSVPGRGPVYWLNLLSLLFPSLKVRPLPISKLYYEDEKGTNRRLDAAPLGVGGIEKGLITVINLPCDFRIYVAYHMVYSPDP